MRKLDVVQQEVFAISDRAHKAFVEVLKKHPQYRAEIAYMMLGNAIGYCDSFGVDVQEFLDDLRRDFPRPAVLVPPKRSQS